MKKKLIPILFIAGFAGLAIALYFYLRHPAIGRINIDKDNGYKLLINDKPFMIKGVCYHPIPIGKDHEFNFWGDSRKPWLVDGMMMKKMGVNTVRFYRPGKNPHEVRKVLDDLYYKFGIRAMMGHYLGYGSWPPPNYTNEEFKQKIRAEVVEMAQLYKDQPGILMWVLGNENNYLFDRDHQGWSNDALDAIADPEIRRKEKAKIYYTFVNDLAKEIKKIDSRHPVALGVGEVTSLEIAKENCPDIDMIAMIAYRGPGFGNLFREVKRKFDLPVVMSEWGADSYNAFSKEPDEASQAEFLKLQWNDIERNADPKKGVGNCLGGTLFEWNDEWWKGSENLPHTWSLHETTAHWSNASYYYDADVTDHMNMNEEWFGIVGLDFKKNFHGLNKRVPKEAYYLLKSFWTKKGVGK